MHMGRTTSRFTLHQEIGFMPKPDLGANEFDTSVTVTIGMYRIKRGIYILEIYSRFIKPLSFDQSRLYVMIAENGKSRGKLIAFNIIQSFAN